MHLGWLDLTPWRRSYQKLKRMVHAVRGHELWQRRQIRCREVSLGSEGARWCFCPDYLSPSSVVYSFGVGQDVSFDVELIRCFGVRVYAFDPTPQSITWLRNQKLPTDLKFQPYGLADFDGTSKFLPPMNPTEVSHTLVERATPWPAIEVSMYRLTSIMKMLGHKQIDLLKMDIEGAEYRVLADILSQQIPIKQLLVEFHHRWPEVGVEKTRQAIRSLNCAGYQIFSVSPNGEEYSFVSRE